MSREGQDITDRTLYIQNEEMFAYNRLIQWVHNQPMELLRRVREMTWFSTIS